MVESVYQVKGMDCQHCVNAVVEEFKGFDSVRSVSADILNSSVVVDSEPPLTLGQAKTAIEEAGFVFAGEHSNGQ